MTGESAVSNSGFVGPLPQSLLRQAGLCGHPTRSGKPCRAPWSADANQCGMGHGLSQEQLSELRRRAGQASHAVEAQVESWVRRIDWSSPEGVHDTLEMAAEMVMRRLLSPQQAGAIAQLAGVRLRPVAKPEDAPVPLEVIVQKFTEPPA